MRRRELLAAAAGLPLALALPRVAAAQGAGGSAVALVTADRESHVVALDVETGRVVRRIATAAGPRSIESAFQTWAVVAHTLSGRLSLLHAPTLRVVRRIGGFREPRYTAVHPVRDARRLLAYVTDSAAREVVVVDVLRGRIVWRTRVPGPARHVTASTTGDRLWTALGSRAEKVAVLDIEDPLRPRLVRTLLPGFLAHDVVCSSDGEHVWITSGDRGRIAIYERTGTRPVAMLSAGAPPQHLAFRGRDAFVASGDDGTLRRHGPDGTLLDEARVPVGSYNVTSFGEPVTRIAAVTPSLGRGTVATVDARGRVVRVARVARAAHDACLVVI